MRVAIDMDGVLADWNGAFIDLLGRVTQRRLVPSTPYDPPVWNWPQHVGYTDDEVARAWKAALTDTTFWKCLDPRPGAVAFLDRLWRHVSRENWTKSQNHEVYFVTNRGGVQAKDQTEAWLRRWGYPNPTVLIARGEKGPLVGTLGLTDVVDDRPENLVSYQVCGMDPSRTVCLAGGYNAAYRAAHPAVPVVETFDELAFRWGIA